MGWKRFSDEEVLRAWALHRAGKTVREIMTSLGRTSPGSVSRMLRDRCNVAKRKSGFQADRHIVCVGGIDYLLPRAEATILHALSQADGIVGVDALMKEAQCARDSVRVLISNLRRKLADNHRIKAFRNRGYKLI